MKDDARNEDGYCISKTNTEKLKHNTCFSGYFGADINDTASM